MHQVYFIFSNSTKNVWNSLYFFFLIDSFDAADEIALSTCDRVSSVGSKKKNHQLKKNPTSTIESNPTAARDLAPTPPITTATSVATSRGDAISSFSNNLSVNLNSNKSLSIFNDYQYDLHPVHSQHDRPSNARLSLSQQVVDSDECSAVA